MTSSPRSVSPLSFSLTGSPVTVFTLVVFTLLSCADLATERACQIPCGAGALCVDGRCVTPCEEDSECPAEQSCQGGECRRAFDCQEDLDCPTGRCVDGRCEPRRDAGVVAVADPTPDHDRFLIATLAETQSEPLYVILHWYAGL